MTSGCRSGARGATINNLTEHGLELHRKPPEISSNLLETLSGNCRRVFVALHAKLLTSLVNQSISTGSSLEQQGWTSSLMNVAAWRREDEFFAGSSIGCGDKVLGCWNVNDLWLCWIRASGTPVNIKVAASRKLTVKHNFKVINMHVRGISLSLYALTLSFTIFSRFPPPR